MRKNNNKSTKSYKVTGARSFDLKIFIHRAKSSFIKVWSFAEENLNKHQQGRNLNN